MTNVDKNLYFDRSQICKFLAVHGYICKTFVNILKAVNQWLEAKISSFYY